MAKISRLVGKWKGNGWIIGPHGKSTSSSEETVESRLDGRAFLIEGFHTDSVTGAINHHALAILAWDDARREYRMASALASGRTGSFPGKVEDAVLRNEPLSREVTAVLEFWGHVHAHPHRLERGAPGISRPAHLHPAAP
jgi:hypothetical protein